MSEYVICTICTKENFPAKILFKSRTGWTCKKQKTRRDESMQEGCSTTEQWQERKTRRLPSCILVSAVFGVDLTQKLISKQKNYHFSIPKLPDSSVQCIFEALILSKFPPVNKGSFSISSTMFHIWFCQVYLILTLYVSIQLEMTLYYSNFLLSYMYCHWGVEAQN